MFLRRKQQQASSDEELVVAIKAGRSEALGVLWDRYAHLLFAVGMKYLKDTEAAKDAVMTVFAELPSLIARHEVRNTGGWLHTVMRNHCLMQLRGSKPLGALNGTQPDEADDLLAAHLENEDMLRRMERAIDELAEDQRNCIKLFYLDRLSYAEVGERLNMAFDTVRSNIQNGRRNLRIIIERGTTHNTP
ncbi:MAG: sigma-70 family RNA polymerase sigma factor [Flavobacteriales bacterium]